MDNLRLGKEEEKNSLFHASVCVREILYNGMGQLSLKNWKKTVLRPKGRQLDKFKSLLFVIMKKVCFKSLWCLSSGPQRCFRAILVKDFPVCVVKMMQMCVLKTQ